jgi:hypothetical protein
VVEEVVQVVATGGSSGNQWQVVEEVVETGGNWWQVVEVVETGGGKWWKLMESSGN